MLTRTIILSLCFGLALSRFPIPQLVVPGEVHTATEWSWTDCGLPGDAIQITSLQVSPDPPEVGKTLTIHATGHVNEVIDEGAYADVTVKLGLIKILSKRFDVCEEALNANATIQCPVKEGDYDVSQSVELPKEIPRAKFGVSVRGYTAEDDDMVCLDIKIDFLHR